MTDFLFVLSVLFFAFLTGMSRCMIMGFALLSVARLVPGLVVPTGLEPVFPP